MRVVFGETVHIAVSGSKSYNPWELGARSVKISAHGAGTASYLKVYGRDAALTETHFLAGVLATGTGGQYGPSVVLPMDWPVLYLKLTGVIAGDWRVDFFDAERDPLGTSYLAGGAFTISGSGNYTPFATAEMGLAREAVVVLGSAGNAHGDLTCYVGAETIGPWTAFASASGVRIVRGSTFPDGITDFGLKIYDDSGSSNASYGYALGILGR